MTESESYSRVVMDHFLNPRHVGGLEDPSVVGEHKNPQCGDIVRLYLKIENDVIRSASMKTFGCTAAIASASRLTERLIGETLSSAQKEDVEALLSDLEGLPDFKVPCAQLALDALGNALSRYRNPHASS